MDEIASNFANVQLNRIVHLDNDCYLSDEDIENPCLEKSKILNNYRHDAQKEYCDLENYIIICKYFLNSKETRKNSKHLQIFYQKMYRKVVIYKKNLLFDKDNEIYSDLNNKRRALLDVLKKCFTIMRFNIKQRYRDNLNPNKNKKKTIESILKFYSYLKEFFHQSTDYDDAEEEYTQSINIMDNLMKIL